MSTTTLTTQHFSEHHFVFSIHHELLKLSFDKRHNVIEKLKKLSCALQSKYNIEIRDDSRLVWNYLLNMSETEINHVCEELWYINLIYNFSDYSDICKRTIPNVKYCLMKGHEEHPLCSRQTWEHIQNFVIPSIKINCMGNLIENQP